MCGWVGGCRDCVARRAKLNIKPNHSKECRNRLLRKLEVAEDGSERINQGDATFVKKVVGGGKPNTAKTRKELSERRLNRNRVLQTMRRGSEKDCS